MFILCHLKQKLWPKLTSSLIPSPILLYNVVVDQRKAYEIMKTLQAQFTPTVPISFDQVEVVFNCLHLILLCPISKCIRRFYTINNNDFQGSVLNKATRFSFFFQPNSSKNHNTASCISRSHHFFQRNQKAMRQPEVTTV